MVNAVQKDITSGVSNDALAKHGSPDVTGRTARVETRKTDTRRELSGQHDSSTETHFASSDSTDFEPNTRDSGDTNCSVSGSDKSILVTSDNSFMYLNVFVGCQQVTALLDAGSSVDIVSRALYEHLTHSVVSNFTLCDDKVVLANNTTIKIFGTANVLVRNSELSKPYAIFVYILGEASQPMIFGTGYIKAHKIELNFAEGTSVHGVRRTSKVRCKTSFVIAPNSECMVKGKLTNDISNGMQGICEGHSELVHKGLLLAKAVVTCTPDHIVQLKILNARNDSVYVQKGTFLSKFSLLDNTADVASVSCNNVSVKEALDPQSESSSPERVAVAA